MRDYDSEQIPAFASNLPQALAKISKTSDSIFNIDSDRHEILKSITQINHRIHEQIKNEFPEFCEYVLEQIHPELLRPRPSQTIVEFSSLNSKATEVESGVTFYQRHTANNFNTCKFQTEHALTVNPLNIDSVSIQNDSNNITFTFDFSTNEDSTLAAVNLERLAIYISNETQQAKLLLYILTTFTKKIRVIFCDEIALLEGQQSIRLKDDRAQKNINVFDVLQEVFSFPEKVNFIEIMGLESALQYSQASSFSLEVTTDHAWRDDLKLSANMFKLNCVSASNLFEKDAEPFLVESENSEHLIQSDSLASESIMLYDIKEVRAQCLLTHMRSSYLSYAQQYENKQYYLISRREQKNYILLCRNASSKQSVSLRLWVCNSPRAIKEVTCETFDFDEPTLNGLVSGNVIVKPSSPVLPIAKQHLPELISLLVNFNISTFLNLNLMKKILALLLQPKHQKFTHALLTIDSQNKNVFCQQVLYTFKQFFVVFDDELLTDENSVIMLGMCLRGLLNIYQNITECWELSLRGKVSDCEYKWKSSSLVAINDK